MVKQLRIIIAGLILGAMTLTTYLFFGYMNTYASPAVYEGIIRYGFEGRSFTPCNHPKELWWVSSRNGDIGFELHHATAGNHYQPAYIKALMEVSGEGEYGHFGMSKREVTLLKVEHLSSIIPGYCS